MTFPNLAPLPPEKQGSPSRAGRGFDTASLMQHQIGRAVAASHTGLVTRSNLIPIVTGFSASRAAGVVHSVMFTLGGWWGEGVVQKKSTTGLLKTKSNRSGASCNAHIV